MGNLKGVDIRRGTLGASVLGNLDAVSGLLCNGPAISADVDAGIIGVAVGEAIRLTSLADANAYGFNELYDSGGDVQVYRHIREFYRMAGEGTPLWLMLYTGTPSVAFGDSYGKKLIAAANGEIRQLAVACVPASTVTYVDGLDGGVRAAIAPAQAFYEWSYEAFRPCQVILECRDFHATTATAALNLRGIEDESGNVLQYYKVSLCIHQDWKYAETLSAKGKMFADVGTLLGRIASLSVNRNVGEVQNGSVTDVMKGIFTEAGLSNHKTVKDFESNLEALDEKGYIFLMQYAGLSGFYFNNDHTCTPVILDEDGYYNEYSISLGRTHDKAVRNLRTKLLPLVKSTQPVDPKTGKLPKALVTSFEKMGDSVFAAMLNEISSGKTYVDGDSNLQVPPRELKVSFVIVPMGQIDVIKGKINLKTSI
jgi:hypothetical protein